LPPPPHSEMAFLPLFQVASSGHPENLLSSLPSPASSSSIAPLGRVLDVWGCHPVASTTCFSTTLPKVALLSRERMHPSICGSSSCFFRGGRVGRVRIASLAASGWIERLACASADGLIDRDCSLPLSPCLSSSFLRHTRYPPCLFPIYRCPRKLRRRSLRRPSPRVRFFPSRIQPFLSPTELTDLTLVLLSFIAAKPKAEKKAPAKKDKNAPKRSACSSSFSNPLHLG
jgi:hypothetical protein